MMRTTRILAGLALAAIVCGNAARAVTLEIQMEGLDLEYMGGQLYDKGGVVGGAGVTATADPLLQVSFLLNGSLVGQLSSNIWADMFINNVTSIPKAGGFASIADQGDTFGFHLITSFGRLELNFDQDVELAYLGNAIKVIAGGATVSSVGLQTFFPGLAFDANEPITIAFSSANMSGITDNGTFLTNFKASGTGNIAGVPEPSTLVLAGLAGLGCLYAVRRRK